MNYTKKIRDAWANDAFCETIDAILQSRLEWLDEESRSGSDKNTTIEAIDKALEGLLQPPIPDLKQARDDQYADDAWNDHKEGTL